MNMICLKSRAYTFFVSKRQIIFEERNIWAVRAVFFTHADTPGRLHANRYLRHETERVFVLEYVKALTVCYG